jgi:tight adherence protein C
MAGINQIASTLTDPSLVAGVLAAGACFATVLTLAQPILNARGLDNRLKAVASKREELKRKNRAALASAGKEQKALKLEAKGVMKDIVDKLSLARLLEDENLNDKLTQAGLRGPAPIATFYFFRFAAPIVLGLMGLFYVLFMSTDMDSLAKLGVVVGGAAVGYYLPGVWLSNMAQKRRDSIMKAFPDSLDMLLICVESGMSIEAAMQRVGQEVSQASIELAEEFALTMAELAYLPDRRLAYENLAKRTNHPGVKGVAMALTQAERYGTPLGTALRVMAKENRDMRMSSAEKKAAALPAQLTVPMIVFFIPVLMAVILGPAAIKIMAMQH